MTTGDAMMKIAKAVDEVMADKELKRIFKNLVDMELYKSLEDVYKNCLHNVCDERIKKNLK